MSEVIPPAGATVFDRAEEPKAEKNGHELGPDFLDAAQMAAKDEADRASQRESEPVLEILIPSNLIGVREPAHHLKIWPDGKIEGFEKLVPPGKRMGMVNRIPALINTLAQPMRDYLEDIDAFLNMLNAQQGVRAEKREKPDGD